MSLTEQDWLKNLGIKIVIISRGRADNVITSKLLPSYIEIVAPSGQADDYRKITLTQSLKYQTNVSAWGKLVTGA